MVSSQPRPAPVHIALATLTGWRMLTAYLLVLLVLSLLDATQLGRYVRSGVELALKPGIQVAARAAWVIETPSRTFIQSRNASLRIQDLELRLSEALARLGELEKLRQENKELRQLLENSDRTLRPVVISAPVISFAQPSVVGGSDLGISVGDPVVLAQTLVGVVSEVSEHFSTVSLLSESSVQPIIAVTAGGAEGIVTGDGKRVLLTEVSSDAEIELGERVVTLGQPGIGRDILIGRVAQVVAQPSDPTKTIVIEQITDFNQARVAEVYVRE